VIKSSSVFWGAITLFSFIVSYYGPPFFPLVYLFIWMGILTLTSLKNATIFFLLVMLVEGDVSKYGPLEEASYISVYTTYIFGKSLSLIWTVLNFILFSFTYFKWKKTNVDKFVFPFLLLLIISLCMVITNDRFSVKIFVSDLGYFINFFTGYLAVILFIKVPKDIINFFSCIVVILITKAFIIAFDSVFMSLFGFFNTYAVETGAYLMPIALCYIFLTYSDKKAVNTVALVGIFLFLMMSASRGRIFISGVMLLFTSYVAGKKKAVLILFSFLPVIFLLVVLWNPDTANYFMWKITTFLPSGADAGGKVESMSSMVRLIEFLNIIGLHLDQKYTMVFGTGLSGYFTSDYYPYPFNLHGTSSYPDEWIDNNTFYKPHGSILYVLLKFGLIGYCFIFGTVALLVKKSVYIFNKKVLNDKLNFILISIACFLPFLFIVNFSSKLQVFSGVLFALTCLLVNKSMWLER